MTHPFELSRQATNLWLQAASLTWRAATLPLDVSLRVAGAVYERMLPGGERAEAPEPVQAAVAEPARAARPAPKQRRRSAPTTGAEVRVAAPWEGYEQMSAADVVQRLADADETTRAAVRLYEAANQEREAILHATEG